MNMVGLVHTRDDPVQECCAKAVLKLTQLVKEHDGGQLMDPVRYLRVNDMDCVNYLSELKEMELAVVEYECTKCPSFDKHVCV